MSMSETIKRLCNAEINRQGFFKKKFRWTFEGKNQDGETIFPESFVKLSDRPDFPLMAIGDENGGHFEPVPGDLSITLFGDSDQCQEFIGRQATAKDITWSKLKMYDGCGQPIEQWELFEVKVIAILPNFPIFENNEYEAEWYLTYQKAEWHALIETTDQTLPS